MIHLPNIALPPETLLYLHEQQERVNSAASYQGQVAAAKALFAKSNKKKNTHFTRVKASLDQMCSGARRCVYCEDSCADEVEHIQPKDIYPEFVFVWENYVYACGPCNGPKNNRFAIIPLHNNEIVDNEMVDVTRRRRDPIIPPKVGMPALINPREEDPLAFMELDLLGTFIFRPTAPKGTLGHTRACYTIDILYLNKREVLVRAREEAFESYRARLDSYVNKRRRGASEESLQMHARAIQRMQHPTVWSEMKRKRDLIPELQELFNTAPEALDW